MKFKLLFLVLLSVSNVSAGNKQKVIMHKSWSADNGNGTYTNVLIPYSTLKGLPGTDGVGVPVGGTAVHLHLRHQQRRRGPAPALPQEVRAVLIFRLNKQSPPSPSQPPP